MVRDVADITDPAVILGEWNDIGADTAVAAGHDLRTQDGRYPFMLIVSFRHSSPIAGHSDPARFSAQICVRIGVCPVITGDVLCT